jgi:hypothetical protein
MKSWSSETGFRRKFRDGPMLPMNYTPEAV